MADPVPQVTLYQPPDAQFAFGDFGIAPGGLDALGQYTGTDVAALIGQPPGYTTNPVTGEVQPPSATGPSVPTPGQSPGPSGVADGWLPFGFGAMSNPFYRVTRRVRATKLTKFLESEARVGLKALGDWWSNTPRLGTEIAEVGLAAERFPWAARLAGGFLGGMVASAILPERLSDSDQFPLSMKALRDPLLAARVKNLVNIDQFQRVRNKPSAAVRELASPVPDVTLELREPTTAERLGRILGGYQDIFSIGRLLNPPGWTPIRPGAKVLDANAPGLSGGGGGLRDFIGAGVPGTFAPGGRGPTSAPASSSTSPATSSSPAGHNVTLPRPAIQWGKIGLGLGAIFAVNVIANRAGRSGGGSSFVIPPPAITNTVAPAATQAPLIVGGYAGGFSSGAYCEPRPRGPRRKCLERAPVAWRAGRNKGKAAGSKCLRYAQRKS